MKLSILAVTHSADPGLNEGEGSGEIIGDTTGVPTGVGTMLTVGDILGDKDKDGSELGI